MYSNKFWSFKRVCVSHLQWLNPGGRLWPVFPRYKGIPTGVSGPKAFRAYPVHGADLLLRPSFCRRLQWTEVLKGLPMESGVGHPRPREAVASRSLPGLSAPLSCLPSLLGCGCDHYTTWMLSAKSTGRAHIGHLTGSAGNGRGIGNWSNGLSIWTSPRAWGGLYDFKLTP